MGKDARLRLDEQDRKDMIDAVLEKVARETDPEKKFRLVQLATRLGAPHRGHPRQMTMETMSAIHYAAIKPGGKPE